PALETPGLQEAQLLQNDELGVAELGGADRATGRASVDGLPNRKGKPPGAALGAGGRHQLINCTLGVLDRVYGKSLLFGFAALRRPLRAARPAPRGGGGDAGRRDRLPAPPTTRPTPEGEAFRPRRRRSVARVLRAYQR